MQSWGRRCINLNEQKWGLNVPMKAETIGDCDDFPNLMS